MSNLNANFVDKILTTYGLSNFGLGLSRNYAAPRAEGSVGRENDSPFNR